MSGQSFQFTPGGVEPLAEPSVPPGAIINAGAAVEAMRRQGVAKAAPVAQPAHPAQHKPLKRRSLVQQIRAELRDAERELKRLKRVERDVAELRRLLAAAKQPPATVADIHKTRKSG
jgi:hypothetical protein